MSNELDVQRTTDFSEKEQAELQKYIEEGTPGVNEATDEKIKKMWDMYILGKTYTQLSGIMRIPRAVVLFVSHKLQWFEHKHEYLVDLEETKRQRVIEAKLMSQDFLLTATQAFHKKYTKKMNAYLAGDDTAMNDMDWKGYDRYLKTIERLEKAAGISAENLRPLVGINMQDGMTMKRTGDNEVEITPKEKSTENMLKHLADLQREKNKKK